MSTPGDPSGDSVVVAAFDFDETLTTRDTVVPFLRMFTSAPKLVAGLALRPLRTLDAVARRDRSRLREVATEIAFAGRLAVQVAELAEQHARALIDEALRSDVVARLRWHLDQGHRVVIVSASYEDYLRPVADHLGVEAILSTRLEVSDGRCTGRLDGPNCRAEEKVRRLHAWLADEDLERDAVTLWAYGDSPGDRALLDEADAATWVRDRIITPMP